MNTPRAFVERSTPAPAAPQRASRWWSTGLNPPLRHWQGLRVWVVGASSGIGAATASALHAQGAQVLVSARNAAALHHFVAQHSTPPDGAAPHQPAHPPQAWPLDVTDAAAVARTAQAMQQQGPLDMVIYCAGHYHEMRAHSLDLADLKRHLDINYVGALHVAHAVLPGMMSRGQGHISFISSVAGFRGLPKSLAYGPTKAALTHLAEALYLDLQSMGLGVSVIQPGFVQTPLTAQNDFTMPALITPEQAAQAMLDGWAQGEFEIHYPKRFTYWMKLLRLLPYRLYFPAVRRFTGV